MHAFEILGPIIGAMALAIGIGAYILSLAIVKTIGDRNQ